MKSKLNNPKLVKTTIINKLGHKQTVYIRPDDPRYKIVKKVERGKENKDITLYAKPVLRRKDRVKVSKKGDVYLNPDSYEYLKEKYEKSKPFTWKLMTEVEWKKFKNGEYRANLSNYQWKKLLKENDKLIHFIAKKYAFGEVYSERYKELKAVGQIALIEAINKYHKVFNPNKPFDFSKFAYAYIHGRIKESVANRLDAGLRIPKNLQKPYQEYLDIKNRLQGKLGIKPSREILAKELAKIWNKKTFYSDYVSAEQRTYGIKYVVKTKKTGRILYSGTDIKKAKSLYAKDKRNRELVKETRTFDDLTDKEKAQEIKKDALPMEGWVSVSKEGVLKSKEEKHQEKISKIEEEYQKKKESLEATYYSTNNMSVSDKARANSIIQILQKRVDDNKKLIEDFKKKKLEKIDELEKQIEQLKDKLSKYKTKTSKQYKETLKQIKNLENSQYRDNLVRDYNLKIRELEEKQKNLDNDLQMSKQLFEPMTKSVFEKRLQELENEKQNLITNEVHRYNKDTSSTIIPGIIDRIKEFEQIEAIKEIPLNLQVESEEGEGRSNLEVVYSPEQLSEEEKQELIQQHEIGKQALKDALNMLVPVYKDIMALRMGLHKESKPTVDNLWGELATAKDIQNYLDKKHNVLLSNPDKFVELVNKIDNEADRFLIVRSLPYVVDRYFYQPELLVKDYKEWQDSKPREGKLKKVKLPLVKYRKLRKNWLNAKKKARMLWKKWRKNNPKANQEQSKKMYDKIKEKYKASNKYKPKKFVLAKQRVTKQQLDRWRNKKPKIFAESDSAKEAFILNAIKESSEILRRVVPLSQVKSLLTAHRKLVESGVSLEKSLLNIFSKSISNTFFKIYA